MRLGKARKARVLAKKLPLGQQLLSPALLATMVSLSQDIAAQLINGILEAIVIASLGIAAKGSLECVKVIKRAQNQAGRRAQCGSCCCCKKNLVLFARTLNEVGG